MEEFNIGTPKIIKINVPEYPPWLFPEINICFELAQFSKSTEFLHHYLNHKHESDLDFFTDGSKTNIGVGSGIALHFKKSNEFTKWRTKLNKLS